MSFVVRNVNNWDKIGENFGEGAGEQYLQGSDDRAIRKAVDSLPPNASYKDILKAVSGVNTFNPKSKQNALENYAKSHEMDLKEEYYKSKTNNAKKKQDEAIELDMAEQTFLEANKGKRLSPVDTYNAAREAKLPPQSAIRLSNLRRLEEKEDRINRKNLTDMYDYEIKALDRQIKEAARPSQKEPLQKKREELQNMRKRDLDKWEKGERNFKSEIEELDKPLEPEKPRFDNTNPEHRAKATALYQQLGDREKVREALRQEFEI